MDIFSEFAPLGLRNRTVMAPMTRCACAADGMVTDQLGEYYTRRARNGLGLIIVEASAVNGAGAMGYVGGCQFHSDAHAAGWRPIVDQIHQAGAKVWIQLFHAGRLTVPAVADCRALAPSAIVPFKQESFWRPKVKGDIVHFQTQTPFEVPTEMSIEQIDSVIADFEHACRLASAAGFDGVELHGAHGYLLHSFCHPAANQRSDNYAASTEFRFILDLVKACRSALPESTTLSYRLSLHMVDMTFVRFSEKELDYSCMVRLLDQAGVDVFHCSELESGAKMLGGNLSLSQLVDLATQKPVISCGRISGRAQANTLLENGADLVAFGRSLIANPDLVLRLQNEERPELTAFDYGLHFDRLV